MVLCVVCKALNITLSSFITEPGLDDSPRLRDPLRSLGSLRELEKRQESCPFCRVLFAAFRCGLLRGSANVSDRTSLEIFAKWISPLGLDRDSRRRTPSLCIIVWAAKSIYLQPGQCKITIRAVSDILLDQPHFGRISKGISLDFEEIKGWVRCCERKHTACGDASTPPLPTKHFFVLDVRHRCIIEAPEHCRYVALSYVWGGVGQYMLTEDNVDRLKQRFSLRPEHLTATIQDAIVLTQKIGEQYLWVDTLCVIQDSRLIRQQTLLDMGQIFKQSLMTIVAGNCSSANDRLPGVTKARVWKSWAAKVSPALSISAHYDFKDLLEHATYNQRAWTFQEYQAASRLLVFAPNDQVYFSCKEAVYAEDVIPSTDLDTDVAMLQSAELAKLRLDPANLWATYRQAAETYSSRKLTRQEDALEAFSGILHTLCGTRCVEGLPATLLDAALLWQPCARLRRREEFSSWSWIGWAGRIQYLAVPRSAVGEVGGHLRSWIVWYCSSGANCDTPAFFIDGPPRLHGTATTGDEYVKLFGGRLQSYTPTSSLLPDRLRTSKRWRRDHRFLQFWTYSTRLRIALDTYSVTHNDSLQAENTGRGLRRFSIYNQVAQCCGWVLLNESWIETVANGTEKIQEFILLSEVDSNDWQFDGRAYNAMMIEWDNGIAMRAGLGQIVKEGLEDSRQEWKEILLG